MPYLPRYLIISDDSYFHVTWQCHNKDWLLKCDWAKNIYYDLLLKYKEKYGIEIYAYNFMDNHPHLVGHLKRKEDFSAFFRVVNCQFAKKLNKHLKRCGQVVMDRFKSPQIESDKYMLTVMRYIDLNQYRVRKVRHPRQNKWSSYCYYAYGRKDPLITPAPSYLGLSESDENRQKIYREMVNAVLNNPEDLNISHTYFVGNPEWVIGKYNELQFLLLQIRKKLPELAFG
ncbi:MAG: transposase [Deltaproteobacteria bacterium]|nr:transposase [Deltaproteobacteria bacterium]MBI2974934.1 transposase [Deltaproteobacteria bacterium]